MKNDIQLSEHFKLSEFTRSATSTARKIDNTPSQEVISNLKVLCQNVLEPLRAFAQQPIIISSGYRCPQLNIKVGGVYSSQHTLGEACDIHIPVSKHTPQCDGKAHTDKEILNSWFDWIVSNTDFDQAIIETANGKDFWIHVSCRRNKRKNRHQVIRNLQKK